jgi:hypothetical protein
VITLATWPAPRDGMTARIASDESAFSQEAMHPLIGTTVAHAGYTRSFPWRCGLTGWRWLLWFR